MKPGLFILPFLALLSAAIGASISVSAPSLKLASAIGWSIGAILLVTWIALDARNFQRVFLRKGSKFGMSSGLNISIGIAIIIGIALLTNRPRFNQSWDTTENSINTLSEQSIKVMKKIEAEEKTIEMTAFLQNDNVKDAFKNTLKLYTRIGGDVSIRYLEPAKNPKEALAANLTSENTVIISQGDNETRITSFSEDKITNAMIQVLKNEVKKVYFTSGHGEGQLSGQDPTGFEIAKTLLENARYEVGEISLLETAQVPEDAHLVVLAGPNYDLKKEELRILDNYLSRGGALLSLTDAVKDLPNVKTLLGNYGIGLNDDLLIMNPEDPRALFVGNNRAIVNQFESFHSVTQDFAKQSRVELLIPFTRSLTEIADAKHKMNVTLAAKTSEEMIQIKGVRQNSDLEENMGEDRIETGSFAVMAIASGQATNPQMASANQGNGAQADAQPDAGLISGSKETRIVAIGSAQFAQNQGMQVDEAARDLFMNSASFLLQDEDFISIAPKTAKAGQIAITSTASALLLFGLSYLYPFLFLGGGVFFWLKRRNA